MMSLDLTFTGSYNNGFMALSFFKVVFASFQTFDLTGRVIALNSTERIGREGRR
jgi:hypothetical protein